MLSLLTQGDRYGRLVAIKFHGQRQKDGRSLWKFQCDCGSVTIELTKQVKNGHKQSCGCLRSEMTLPPNNLIHGMTRSPEYVSWQAMLKRCADTIHKSYNRYGGRGIKVCDQWLSFKSFYADMGDRPSQKHSLDRINNDGNYEPINCRWAPPKTQGRNRSTNKRYMIDGESITLSEIAERLNLSVDTVWRRLNRRGWTIENLFDPHLAGKRHCRNGVHAIKTGYYQPKEMQ